LDGEEFHETRRDLLEALSTKRHAFLPHILSRDVMCAEDAAEARHVIGSPERREHHLPSLFDHIQTSNARLTLQCVTDAVLEIISDRFVIHRSVTTSIISRLVRIFLLIGIFRIIGDVNFEPFMLKSVTCGKASFGVDNEEMCDQIACLRRQVVPIVVEPLDFSFGCFLRTEKRPQSRETEKRKKRKRMRIEWKKERKRRKKEREGEREELAITNCT